VTWEIGIWWAHPKHGNDVVVYAECVEGPDALRKKEWALPPRSQGEGWKSFRAGLQLELTQEMDLDSAFARLLNEVAAQLKAIGITKGGTTRA
jgi:hypothetical protein